MSIDPDKWKVLIRDVLQRISDEEYQRLAWFNKHREVSSPDELINQLDDHHFDAFIDSADVGLTSDQAASAKAFLAQLSKFCSETPPILDPVSTIDDPRWGALREAAGSLVRKLFPEAAAGSTKRIDGGTPQ
jgi:hypothetical protein